MASLKHFTAPAKLQDDNLVERVDSGATDESAFGSSLTTPVDEDVQLFHGIDKKLLGKVNEGFLDISGSIVYVGDKDEDGLSRSATPESTLLPKSALRAEDRSGSFVDLSVFGAHISASSVSAMEVDPVQAPAVSVAGTRPRSSSIYTFPNGPINVENKISLLDKPGIHEKPSLDPALPTKVGEDNDAVYYFSALPFAFNETTFDDSFITSETDPLYMLFPKVTLRSVLPNLLRITLFLPWCVAVGGAILVFPRSLELVAFGPGYVESPQGIYRFAYWADSGMQHVGIFFAFLASVGWVYPRLGLLLLGGVAAQFIYAWQDFLMDPEVPLGDDDRQTMYLVARSYGFSGEMDIRKDEDNYFFSRLRKEGVVIEDSDDEI